MARVLFYVQHLMGVGHLKRAACIGRALADRGLEVTLVSGGLPVPGLDTGGLTLEQLPPARAADESFASLVDGQGRAVDDAWRERRRERLLSIYGRVRPAVLITEHFPFGRRQLQFELLPLLEKARASNPRPWVICSVRDILVQASRHGKYQEMAALANAHFDRVLTHGDESLIPFGRTFPLCAKLAPELLHTGYVVEPDTAVEPYSATARNSPRDAPEDEVLVSCGSRARGEPLVAAALAARPLTELAHLPWRILAGIHFPRGRLDELQAIAGPGVMLEGFRADYTQLLRHAALSISQGGYNTTMEVIRAGIPAVLMPHTSGVDNEQALRAQLLSERGAVTLAEGADAQSLARAVDKAMARAIAQQPRQLGGAGMHRLNIDGAQVTARIVVQLARKGPSSESSAPSAS